LANKVTVTITMDPQVWKRGKEVWKEKLNRKGSTRLQELAVADIEALTGTKNSGAMNRSDLESKLLAITKKRDALVETLRKHKVFDALQSLAVDSYGLDFQKAPDAARKVIVEMSKDYKTKAFEDTDRGDFQLFMILIQIGIERHETLNQLVALTSPEEDVDGGEK
jgi:hypothetical protein